MKQDSDNRRLVQVAEEFDEKVKIIAEAEEEPEEEFNEKQDGTQSDSKPKTSKAAKEMDHIFNQFDEETKSQDSSASRTLVANDTLPRQPEQSAPPREEEVPFDFNWFLEQMRYKSSMPVMRYYKSFIQSFERRPWTVNEQIKIIQDFLDFIYVKMRECDTWREASEQEFSNAQEGMEKLVMNRLFSATFCPTTADDKERDEILYQKISIFRWIHEKHLDIRETEHNESFLSFAQSEILKINNYKAPRDKLICVLNCCKVIFGLIKHVEGDAGADKFLPILIYVVIRANPPRLVSNVQYIYRFRNPEQLQAEAGYYLTNLMGAISFIETMEAKSLSISKEEFDTNIERTMNELKQERPKVTTLDKQQVSYENALHPTRSASSRLPQTQPLLDPAKAAALLERGSQFAQKTMQRPLTFVGKIFQGLSDTSSASSSRAESPEEEDRYQQQQQLPPLPPRPTMHPDQVAMQQRQLFESNLQTLTSMFSNVDQGVCYLVLHANGGDLSRSIDNLLDISADGMNTNQHTTSFPVTTTPVLPHNHTR
ncbi:hypothetical protein BD560DRAFT_389441 [Blakeslea trispora]|nr:hypothetical protein BD560DRAFT_389441 [Blakeslea trispora]